MAQSNSKYSLKLDSEEYEINQKEGTYINCKTPESAPNCAKPSIEEEKHLKHRDKAYNKLDAQRRPKLSATPNSNKL